MFLSKAIMPLAIAITFSSATFAASSLFPHGCEVRGFGFSQGHLVINETGKQAFYLLQNFTASQIELQRVEKKEVFMSPSLTAKLSPSNWAAFASDIENLHFQCAIKKEENLLPVDCRAVLEVCQYPRVKFALSNMGNYWVSTNKAQQEVITEATRKGIYLHW